MVILFRQELPKYAWNRQPLALTELEAVVGVTAVNPVRLVSGVMVVAAVETAGFVMVSMPPLLDSPPKVPEVLAVLFPLLTDLSPIPPLPTLFPVPTLDMVSLKFPILVLLQVVVALEPAAMALTATELLEVPVPESEELLTSLLE